MTDYLDRNRKKNTGKKYKHALECMVNFLYPRVCPVCERILTEKSDNPYICGDCYKKISFPRGSRCIKCSRPVEYESQGLCRNCSSSNLYFDRGLSLMMHDECAKKILYDLKYSNRRDNADMPAKEAAVKCKDVIESWNPQVMIPIPLHRKRQFERGFNQAALLAVRLSEYLEDEGLRIPVDESYLKRSRETKALKSFSGKERKSIIKNAFELNSTAKSEHPYERVLLVDDIYTSGATVSEAARLLKQSGSREVYFLTFSMG